MIMKQKQRHRTSKRLQPYKFKIYNELWKKYKGQLTMEDLAIILNTPLPSLYRIIAKQREFEMLEHNNDPDNK